MRQRYGAVRVMAGGSSDAMVARNPWVTVAAGGVEPRRSRGRSASAQMQAAWVLAHEEIVALLPPTRPRSDAGA
jgi:hypothetical protein